jgi:hypothetical protein
MEVFLFCRHDNLDGDMLDNFVSSKRPLHKSKPLPTSPSESPALASMWEKMDQLPLSEPSMDGKKPVDKTRPKSGLIVRGMMAGPTASSPQVGLLLFLLFLDRAVGTGLGVPLVLVVDLIE